MYKFIILLLITSAFLYNASSQSYMGSTLTYKIGIDNIKLGSKIKKEYLKAYQNIKTIKVKRLIMVNHYYRGKEYIINGGQLKIKTSKICPLSKYKTGMIEVNFPFNAKTETGIILGESTKADVLKAYGEPDGITKYYIDYKDLTFEIEIDSTKLYEVDGKKVNIYNKVKMIRIYEPD
jgi:hypothetical protein